MEHSEQKNGYQIIENPADIKNNKPISSRFLFLLFFFCAFIFSWGGCYNLYEHKFVSSEDVAIPDNTKYEPTYK